MAWAAALCWALFIGTNSRHCSWWPFKQSTSHCFCHYSFFIYLPSVYFLVAEQLYTLPCLSLCLSVFVLPYYLQDLTSNRFKWLRIVRMIIIWVRMVKRIARMTSFQGFKLYSKKKTMSKSSSIHFVQCNEFELPSQLWKEFIPNLSLKLLVSLVTVFNIFQSVFGR